jgi:stage 0 sporulation regulatory protein
MNISELENQIKILRDKMLILGFAKGLLHPETIACSCELDLLIVQFQKELVRSESKVAFVKNKGLVVL